MLAALTAAIPWAIGLALMLALCGLLFIGQTLRRLLFPPSPNRQMAQNQVRLTLSRPQIKPRLPLPPSRNGRRARAPLGPHARSWAPRR